MLNSRLEVSAIILTIAALSRVINAASHFERSDHGFNEEDPFAILDPQNWVNPDNMTWADFRTPPGTNWSNPATKGSIRNFNIALVSVDYSDMPFTISLPVRSTIFNNPQPSAPKLTPEEVPAFYRDFLNTPNELNKGHTLHEYWMGDSAGRFGVDLTAFGSYRLPAKSYQYGIDNNFNPGECPNGLGPCNLNIRTDALGAWRADVGNEMAATFELVFILSAGQDESSTWQEFGEMLFQTKEDVPDSFGPPVDNVTHRNYAKTRYVEWSSWAAASTIWPNAGGGSSTQAESSGMGTYAHELSHLLNIGDNYNNPYGVPLRRSYTGPWSMMSRGSFNGPGGPHTRWKIPPQEGGSMGSYHTMRDKLQLGLVSNTSILILSRETLASSGLAVARITARSVAPRASDLMGIRVTMNADNGTPCTVASDLYCDGRGYNNYEMEVVDRLGADSFQPDSGVMISKTKNNGNSGPFQWMIDANPQDIRLLDFFRPDGTPSYITLGDYRQLADALFHAGTRSGSEYEYVDIANRLHFYVIDIHRDSKGILSYTVAVRSLDGSKSHIHGVSLSRGKASGRDRTKGLTCSFELANNGTFLMARGANHPQNATPYLKSDVYRLEATVEGGGWKVDVPNALVTVEFGKSKTLKVAVTGNKRLAVRSAVVRLTAVSESDPSAISTQLCKVKR
ncbi:M6 family metalloprotease domain-containing protein [Amylocarpus encephaloides]|uniref:M6 family metalloprotease domain-containing protein n=1 Tax=Amylocarpus encephaloides TaxID=45428 RepID=A0A9P8C7Y3_9HELO|nr:M6 family metalloprotease domain-containing protein [Amylocarpus encephaloides]